MSSLLGGYWNSSLLGGVRKRRRVGVRRSLGMGVRRIHRPRRMVGHGLSGVGLSGVGRRKRRVARVHGSARGRALRYRVKRSGGAIYAAGRYRVHRRRVSGSARGFGRRRVYRHRVMGSASGRGRRHVSMLNPARLLLNRYVSGGYHVAMHRLGMRSKNYGSRLAKPRMRQHRYAARPHASARQLAYRAFMRSHLRSAPGTTQQERMRNVAKMWRQSHH